MGLVRDGWCQGSRCTGTGVVEWADIRENARVKFGPFDARLQRMDLIGTRSAVDN